MPVMRSTPHVLHAALRPLMHTLVVAGLITWLAVALSLHFLQPSHVILGWTLLLAYLAAFLAEVLLRDGWAGLRTWLLLLEPALALVLLWLDPGPGTAQALLIVWITQIITAWTAIPSALAILATNIAMYGVFVAHGYDSPFVVTMLNVGFQIFAVLCAHYAYSAGQARDRLVMVNADLLATRALLAESVRDAERLRMARELHDVAGHKLTAITLNLRALTSNSDGAVREEVRTSQRLARELLADIRGVVEAIREGRGLDLATALRALAAPISRPALRLTIDNDVRINDAAVAEAILRLVQEALTNSARHAGASNVDVRISSVGARVSVVIEDDGHISGLLREGNGIAGMRERIATLRGELCLGTNEEGALRIAALLPVGEGFPR